MAAFVVTEDMANWLRLEGGPVDKAGHERTATPGSLLPSDAEGLVKEICRRRPTDQAELFQALQGHCDAIATMAEMAAVCGNDVLVTPFNYTPIPWDKYEAGEGGIIGCTVVVIFNGVVYGPGCLMALEEDAGLVRFSEIESEWYRLENIRCGNQLREVNVDLANTQGRLGLKSKVLEGSVCRETLLSAGRGAKVSWVDAKVFVPKDISQAADFEPYSGFVVAVDLLAAGFYVECSGATFYVPMELIVDVEQEGGSLTKLSLLEILKNSGGKRIRVPTNKFDAADAAPPAHLRRASTRSPARSVSTDSAAKAKAKGRGAAGKAGTNSRDSTPSSTPKAGSPVATSGNRSDKLLATFGLNQMEPGADQQRLREIKNLLHDHTLILGDIKAEVMKRQEEEHSKLLGGGFEAELEAKISTAVSKALGSTGTALSAAAAKAISEVADAGLASARHIDDVAQGAIKAIEVKAKEVLQGHQHNNPENDDVMHSSFDEDSEGKPEPAFVVPAIPPLRSPASSPVAPHTGRRPSPAVPGKPPLKIAFPDAAGSLALATPPPPKKKVKRDYRGCQGLDRATWHEEELPVYKELTKLHEVAGTAPLPSWLLHFHYSSLLQRLTKPVVCKTITEDAVTLKKLAPALFRWAPSQDVMAYLPTLAAVRVSLQTVFMAFRAALRRSGGGEWSYDMALRSYMYAAAKALRLADHLSIDELSEQWPVSWRYGPEDVVPSEEAFWAKTSQGEGPGAREWAELFRLLFSKHPVLGMEIDVAMWTRAMALTRAQVKRGRKTKTSLDASLASSKGDEEEDEEEPEPRAPEAGP